MKRKFTVDASKKIQAAEDMDDPRIEELSILQDTVEEDFNYVLAGIERLGRENMYDEAISLLNTLADTLNSAIGIIGDDFDQGTTDSGEL